MTRVLEFIAAHWVLVSLFAIAFIWLIVEESRHQGIGGARLTTHQVTELINRENAVVIDLRDNKAFVAGHIVNSVNIPYATLDQKTNKIENYKSRPLIFVCNAGQQSLQAMHKLRKKGIERVHVLGGGITAWRRANLPLVKG